MKNPKTSKGKKTKAQIVEKSIELIREKGFTSVTLQDLCKASGVANGTFYHYFSSTTDILRELILLEVEDMKNYHASLTIDTSFEMLMAVLRYQIQYLERKGRDVVSNIITSELINRSGILLPFRDSAKKLLSLIIQKGQDSGEFSTRFPHEFHTDSILALVFFKAFEWLMEAEETSLIEDTMKQLGQEISRLLK